METRTAGRKSRGWVVLAVLSVLALLAVLALTNARERRDAGSMVPARLGQLDFVRTTDGGGTSGTTSDGDVVMSFTDGSRTVELQGPERTFAEDLLPDVTVTTSSWVRLLPQPWEADAESEDWFADWYASAADFDTDDLLATAMEYIHGAADEYDENGVRFRGDADYGDLDDDGRTREVGGDFNDYLEIDWTYPAGNTREANPDEAGYVDCSGFIRLLYGYRMGMDMKFGDGPDDALPRKADDIGRHGPGHLLADTPEESQDFIEDLRAGDLVLFSTDDDGTWNHVGFYLGEDSEGGARFFSSRGTANGPTMADHGGTSLLDDSGYYSDGFTGVRRL